MIVIERENKELKNDYNKQVGAWTERREEVCGCVVKKGLGKGYDPGKSDISSEIVW